MVDRRQISCSRRRSDSPDRDTDLHTHTAPFPGLPRVRWYQKDKTNLDFTEARDSQWQRHQLGHMQVCTLLQTDNNTNTLPLSILQAGCPSCHPTNSVKALKANTQTHNTYRYMCTNTHDHIIQMFSLGIHQTVTKANHFHKTKSKTAQKGARGASRLRP